MVDIPTQKSCVQSAMAWLFFISGSHCLLQVHPFYKVNFISLEYFDTSLLVYSFNIEV